MKKLLFILLASCQLFATSFYTLDNVSSLSIYMKVKASFITPDKTTKIKTIVTEKLKKEGFVFGKVDARTLMVQIEAIEIEDSQAIYIQIGLAEDVITKRKDNVETFAFTYLADKFIEGYDPYKDTVETVENLIDGFIDAHKDDNE